MVLATTGELEMVDVAVRRVTPTFELLHRGMKPTLEEDAVRHSMREKDHMAWIVGLSKVAIERRKEVADTILYAVLVAARVGVDLQQVLREVFNKKSEEYGFPERL